MHSQNLARPVTSQPQPLLITAFLASELCGDAPQLDALLENRALYPDWMKRKKQDGHSFAGNPIYRTQIIQPILRREIAGWNVSRVSEPIYGEIESERHDFISRKFSSENAQLLAPKERTSINVTGGLFRSYHLPLRLRLVEKVCWFAYGRQKELLWLLENRFPSIGENDRLGYGKIKKWTVEPTDKAIEWWADSPAGKVLMRRLPVCSELPKDLIGCYKARAAVMSPYWKPWNFTEAVVPC